MTASTLTGENFSERDGGNLWREFLERDPRTDCFKIQFPHGVILEQSRRKHFYRGERKLYPSTTSTLERKLSSMHSETERELYRLVSDMRIFEFSQLINNFESVWSWKYCDVLYEALAQHYGLETDWLDIANDFAVALFFATCICDNGEWRPLDKRDLSNDEQSEWGVIFHKPSKNVAAREIELNRYFYSPRSDPITDRPLISDVPKNYPYPFGYQPFARCSLQSGYGIYSRGTGSLQDDPTWEKLLFRQSVELSRSVFEAMDGGRKIYPDESLKGIKPHIEVITHATRFSPEAFSYALERNHLFQKSQSEACLNELSRFTIDGKEVRIAAKPWSLGKSRIIDVDAKSAGERLRRAEDLIVTTRKSLMYLGHGLWAPWMLPEKRDMPGIGDMSYRIIDSIDYANFSDKNAFRSNSMFLTGALPDF